MTRKRNRKMNKSFLSLKLFLFLIFGLNSISMSQSEPPQNNSKPGVAPVAKPANASGITTKKSKASDRLKLEFEEDLVEGGLENTELNFIQMRKENNFKKMIKIRENFIPEIEGSSSELGSK